jgi:hypothetical protein
MRGRKIKKCKLARDFKAKRRKTNGRKVILGTLQNNFCGARATNLPKKITLPMISNFSQQILTFLEDTYIHATRLKLPEQLIKTRAIQTLRSKDGHCSTNSKTSCTASHLCHPLYPSITTTKRTASCATEFLDIGSTCNTSLVRKRTSSIVLKHIRHTICTRRFESYCF